MERQSFNRRIVFPICLVLGVMILSSAAYDFSRYIENQPLHLILSYAGAVFMFLSIWLGSLFANTLAFFKGATFAERMLVCLVTPLVWCIKILSSFWGLYTLGEFLFLFLHHFIIGCPLVALMCMGFSEIWCRIIARRKIGDKSIKIFALNNSTLLFSSIIAVVLMLWNGGHSYYYLYMGLYARLFL